VERAAVLATAYEALGRAVLQEPGAIPKPRPAGAKTLAKGLRRYLAAAKPEEHGARLRRFAERQRWRIALRELLPAALGGADLEETAAELSALAEVTIQAALDEATTHVFSRTGPLKSSDESAGKIVVMGMGKLGGRELNAGSDVDLVCFYDSDEPAAADLSPHELWTRVIRRLTATLADVT
jgi:glutamate-ammonia-ligase adenylyltransferase